MILTRPSRRAGGFALPLRALVCTSTCAVLGLPLLAACTNNAPAEKPGAGGAPNPRALTVQATDTECKLSATSAPSGTLTFANGTVNTTLAVLGQGGSQPALSASPSLPSGKSSATVTGTGATVNVGAAATSTISVAKGSAYNRNWKFS